MGLLDRQEEDGLVFHDSNYNWNNLPEEAVTPTQPTQPTQTQQAPMMPQSQEYVVEDTRGTFEDITPDAVVAQAIQHVEQQAAEVPDNGEDLYNNVNTGLLGLNQFFHNVIDKEFKGGFMGFNPMNSMAHSAISGHMKDYSNPNKITPSMIANTRQMIIDKAGSQLGPEKTKYILERFGQYAQQVQDYQKYLNTPKEGVLGNIK